MDASIVLKMIAANNVQFKANYQMMITKMDYMNNVMFHVSLYKIAIHAQMVLAVIHVKKIMS